MLLSQMTIDELKSFYTKSLEEYESIKAKGIKLDMSRGKPSSAQLDLSKELLYLPSDASHIVEGIDVRNYGTLTGLPSCRALFAELLGVNVNQVFAGGSSSLSLMYGTIAKAFTHGMLHSKQPWAKLDKIKFICPVPGYDRHFTIMESFGVEMIPVNMTPSGPDMDRVLELVKDDAVKGIWCVPKYSNPEGIIYSDDTIRALASMPTASPDFTIMWDNAYCVHEFDGEFVPFLNILEECEKAGNPDRVFEFASTSKITFPGAGVACFACSVSNMNYMTKLYNAEAISYDKINHLRHVLFLKNKAGVLELMKKHAELMKPKFDTVLQNLDASVAPLGIATYHRPKGGYFISLNTLPGCAKRTHQLAKEAGVVLTNAGATHPYGVDPMDENLRIAPSLPTSDELLIATEVLCVCIKVAAAEKYLGI